MRVSLCLCGDMIKEKNRILNRSVVIFQEFYILLASVQVSVCVCVCVA